MRGVTEDPTTHPRFGEGLLDAGVHHAAANKRLGNCQCGLLLKAQILLVFHNPSPRVCVHERKQESNAFQFTLLRFLWP